MAQKPSKSSVRNEDKAANKSVRTRSKPSTTTGADSVSRDTRFKPGQSGNPNGRPRKERSLLKHIEDELDAEMQVSEGGKRFRLTKREVLAKAMVNNAIKGDHKALNFLLRILPPAKDDSDGGIATVPLATVLSCLTRRGVTAQNEDDGDD